VKKPEQQPHAPHWTLVAIIAIVAIVALAGMMRPDKIGVEYDKGQFKGGVERHKD
jgi:hypothetical protein